MIWKNLLNFCLALAAICLLACNKPNCKNTNPILQDNPRGSRAYTDELIKQLERLTPEKTTFWLDSFQEMNNNKILHLSVQGEGLCAKMDLKIDQSVHGIENLIEKKGIGYSGAQLKGLKYDVVQTGTNTEFIFKDIKRIID